MYHKRIVCDIDDTISFCDNRDWQNAKPNLPVIQKLKSQEGVCLQKIQKMQKKNMGIR